MIAGYESPAEFTLPYVYPIAAKDIAPLGVPITPLVKQIAALDTGILFFNNRETL